MLQHIWNLVVFLLLGMLQTSQFGKTTLKKKLTLVIILENKSLRGVFHCHVFFFSHQIINNPLNSYPQPLESSPPLALPQS